MPNVPECSISNKQDVEDSLQIYMPVDISNSIILFRCTSIAVFLAVKLEKCNVMHFKENTMQ